jgi:hypothetical protein
MDRKAFFSLTPLAAIAVLNVDRSVGEGVLGPDAERFVGTYTLIAAEGDSNSVGRLQYDRVGRMQVMLHPRERKPLGPQATPEEFRDSIRGMQSYFGTYTVDEVAKTVTHHMEGALSPNDVGRDRVRWYRFVGNRLELLTSQTAANPLVWERLPEG